MYVREYRRTNKNDQFRETGNIDEEKKPGEKHNTICVGHHYVQTNTDNVNKPRALLKSDLN